MRHIWILLPFISSCTTIEYSSKKVIPTHISVTKNHINRQSISGTKDFYLWGLVPEKHSVFIDDNMRDIGFVSSANTRIEEFQTFKQKMYSIISMGMYIPKSYKITSFGIKEDRN